VTERAEQREAKHVAPHVDATRGDAGKGTELRPQRLGVADVPEILADVTFVPTFVIAGKLVVGAAFGQCLGNMLGGEHSGQHGVVAALYARNIDEACGTADQRPARKRQLRHRLITALSDGARAVR